MNTLITKDRLDELVRIGKLTPAGPIAEVGVYKGGSLKYLADAFPDRKLYGFDTFEGLPAIHHSAEEIHQPGEFADTHVESVARFINNPRVELIKGLFPDSVWAIEEGIHFSMVHIDTDFYLSIKACIEWFVPRMLPGGVIVLDDFDWPNCPGVRRALEESGLLWRPTRARYQAAIWQRPLVIRNDNDLIGDFIGTIPAMQEMAKGGPVEVICKDGVAELLEMAGLSRHSSWMFSDSFDGIGDRTFDLHGAFALAAKESLHMTQANFKAMGLPIPKDVLRPFLQVGPDPRMSVAYDYILSPFSRSLPENERWPKERWAELVKAMPDKKFAMVGGPNDDPDYIPGTSVIFGHSFEYLSMLLLNVRHGLISVVTGTSHLAHALGARNFLFCNQGAWGKNPDALIFPGTIPSITVSQVVQNLREWQ